jgi:hypothetical protein
MSMKSDGGMILTGENRRTRRKTCPSATLSTNDPTWIDPGANPGLRGERPATNHLSHGTAQKLCYWPLLSFLSHMIPVHTLLQSGPTSFFPRAKNTFTVWPKSKETFSDIIFWKLIPIVIMFDTYSEITNYRTIFSYTISFNEMCPNYYRVTLLFL